MLEDERAFSEEWAKNNIDLTITDEILNEDTYHLLEGFDGISLQQTMGIPTSMYARLKKDGFKQIAQRSAGVDMYDLEAASENNIFVTNVPAYSPNSVAEFAVSSALNCLRHTQEIQKELRITIFLGIKKLFQKKFVL